MRAVWPIYLWELRKLLAQRRVALGLAAAAAAGPAFVVALLLGGPNPDVLYGTEVRTTGLTVPLVVLSYAARFGVGALLVGLVAGDIVASESEHRTLKLILTRSAGRGRILTAKALASATYASAALVVLGVCATVAGLAAWGARPLPMVVGGGEPPEVSTVLTIPFHEALVLVTLAYATYLLPLLAFGAFAFLLSTILRNGASAVVGTLLLAVGMYGLVEAIGVGSPVSAAVLAAQFDSWQALMRSHPSTAQVAADAAVSLLYLAAFLSTAAVAFRRRDVSTG